MRDPQRPQPANKPPAPTTPAPVQDQLPNSVFSTLPRQVTCDFSLEHRGRHPDSDGVPSHVRSDLRGWLILTARWKHLASRLQAAALLPLLSLDSSRSILDVGCGRGGISNLLACKGHFVVCVDQDTMALANVRALSRELRTTERIALVRADLVALPFRDSAATDLICNSVLEHLEEPEAVLHECARVLTEDGSFGLTTPNRSYRFASRLAQAWRIVLRWPNWLKRFVLTPELALASDIDTAREHLEVRFLHKVLFDEEEIRRLLDGESFEILNSSQYMVFLGAIFHDISYGFRGMRTGLWPYLMRVMAKGDRLLDRPGKGIAIAARLNSSLHGSHSQRVETP